ncbi:MAG: hypothetical protein JST39_21915, partial [Bacteroidetes bacterium]|nr:hypothetical protein [Bacteroidota bacterium]
MKLICMILLLHIASSAAWGQPVRDTTLPVRQRTAMPEDSLPRGFSLDHNSCKNVGLKDYWMSMPVHRQLISRKQPPAQHTPFLQVHGNILYNVNYYSRIDTPYNEKNIYQHTVQTYLDILVKGKYPLRIYLTNRFSNSALFRNFSDFNFSYSNNRFNQLVKDHVRQRYLASLPFYKAADSLQHLLDTGRLKLKSLNAWVENPALLQKMVEQRERDWFHAKKDSLSVKPDSLEIEQLYVKKKAEADSLQRQLDSLESKLQTARRDARTDVNRVCAEIQQADNPAQLKKKMQELHLPDSTLPQGYKTLMAIKSFGLGRSVVNYSELSVKNISINGIQVEYNP